MRTTRLLACVVLTSVAACDGTGGALPPAPAPEPAHVDPPPSPTPPIDPDSQLKSYGLSADEAYGPANAALPLGAELVTMDVFQQTLAQKPTFASATRAAKGAAARAQEEKDDDATIATFLAAHPEYAAQFDSSPTLGPDIRAREDGDLDVDVATVAGAETFVTAGRSARRHVIADTIRTGADRANREKLYAYLRSIVPADAQGSFPAVTPSTTTVDLDRWLGALITYAREINGQAYSDRLTAVLTEDGCLNETTGGAPMFLDTEPSYRHSTEGLWAVASWPNKGATTCVRDQGRRGTCAAHALASALERRELLTSGRHLDLSEQHLYGTYKSQDTDWRDGAHLHPLTNLLAFQGYDVPLERGWVYNPSPLLAALPNAPFHGACAGYGGVCTETSHQAPLQCVNVALWTFCVWKPLPAGLPSGVHVTPDTSAQALLLEAVDPMALVILALRSGNRQVIASLTIDGSFTDAAKHSSGMATNNPKKDGGAHAVHLVGFIANQSLPPTFPQGAGGGYVVVKNSWGRGTGDKGYLYVSVDDLRRTIFNVVLL